MSSHVPGTPYRYRHGWVPVALSDFGETGGFSLDKNGKKPEHGYMVSLPTGETTTPEAEFKKSAGRLIDEHASRHKRELAKPGNYHGAWTEKGNVYLDVSHNHPDIRSAANAALTNKQLSIGDVDKINAEDWDNAFPSTEEAAERAVRSLSAKEDGIQLGSREVAKVGRKYTVDVPDGLPISFNTSKQVAKYLANLPEHKHTEDRDMSHSFITPRVHNTDVDLAHEDGRLAFWKQILPIRTVKYTAKDGSRQQIDFTREYLTELANNQAVDSLGFLLADKNNTHTMDPERWRGKVAKLEVRDDGLYGKVVFANADAAKAVLDNPELGVSARIRPNVEKSDGSTLGSGIIHVLGTLDPQVEDMHPWQATDLSIENDEVLDLSDEEYEDMAAKTDEKAVEDYTDADIEAMNDEELDAFLAEFGPSEEDYTEETDEHEDEDEHKPERELVGAGADMSKVNEDIELANQSAARANARADEALRQLATTKWEATRGEYLSAGVPPHALDLAAPVMSRTGDMVIDLSNTDEDDVNVSTVVRGLLDSMKGIVDLSSEMGHNGTFTEGEDPDKAVLDRWADEF